MRSRSDRGVIGYIGGVEVELIGKCGRNNDISTVPDQLDRFPIATRPYTSGLGREQIAYKPDQAVVELGRLGGRIWAIGMVELI